jgi:hypothetical protein
MSGTGGSVTPKPAAGSLPVPNLMIRRQTQSIPALFERIDLWADYVGNGLQVDLFHPPIVTVNDIAPSIIADRARNRLRLETLCYGPTHRGRSNGLIKAQHGGFRHPSNQDPSSSALVTGPTRGGKRAQGSLPSPHRTAWDVTGFGQTIPVWETVGGFMYRTLIQSNGPGPIEVIANHRYVSKSGNGGVFGYQGKYTPLKLRFRYAMLANPNDPKSWVSGPESGAVWIAATHHPFIAVAPDPFLPHRQKLVLNPNYTPKALNATLGTLVPS